MRLRWTSPAAEDLYRIVQRIQEDNPTAAGSCGYSLRRLQRLRKFRGRDGRIMGTRELVFPSLPYVVVYRIHDEFVEFCAFITAHKIGPDPTEGAQ